MNNDFNDNRLKDLLRRANFHLKILSFFSPILFIPLMSCNPGFLESTDDENTNKTFTCNTQNPVRQLEWINEKINNPTSACYTEKISRGTYQGKEVFIEVLNGALCCTCEGSVIYNCDGEIVFLCNPEEENKIINRKVLWERK